MSLSYLYADPELADSDVCAAVKVEVQDIPSGDAGVQMTLDAMRALIRESASHPAVRKHAERAVSGVHPADHVGQLRAVWGYLTQIVTYLPDPTTSEYLQAPWWVLTCQVDQGRRPGMDCDDLSMLAAALLASLGIETRLRIVSYDPDQEFGHVYPVAYPPVHVLADVEGEWVPFFPAEGVPFDLTAAWLDAPLGMAETRAVEVEVGG